MTTAKNAKSTPFPAKNRIIRAALDLAAEQGWAETGLQDIARRSHLTLGELNEVFEDRSDILAAYARQVDKRILDSIGAPDMDSSERDRLFEIMMERFDVLNEDRVALISVLRSFGGNPKQAVTGLPHLGRSMVWMLEAAGIDAHGPKGAVTALGLGMVYLYTLKVWVGDDSADLSKTMAALDRALDRAESLAGMILTRF